MLLAGGGLEGQQIISLAQLPTAPGLHISFELHRALGNQLAG